MQVMLQQTKQQQEQCAKFSEDVHANAAAAVSNYHKTSRKTKLSHGLILYVQDECSFQQFQAYVS